MTHKKSIEKHLYVLLKQALFDLRGDGIKIGVMVSGGGDSMALLSLVQNFKKPEDIYVLTVDHDLRRGSKKEADFVKAYCKDNGFNHEIKLWVRDKIKGNLQANARDARKKLAHIWAQENNISHILTAHTKTDQAETFLMRLARGSGVDGLTAMRPMQKEGAITLLRPLLGASRSELRTYLTEKEIRFLDDPSNEDTRFDRIKIRNVLPILEEIGLSDDRLAQTAQQMARTRNALEMATLELAQKIARPSFLGTVVINQVALDKAQEELIFRLLVKSMRWITGDVYPPRLAALSKIYENIVSGVNTNLGGVLFCPRGEELHIIREPNSVEVNIKDAIFDNRWVVPSQEKVFALGDNVSTLFPDWRDHNLPKEAWMSLGCTDFNDELRLAHEIDANGEALIRRPQDFLKTFVSH